MKSLVIILLVGVCFWSVTFVFVYADVFSDPVFLEQPAWFAVDEKRGGFYGYTTLGTYFTQHPILVESGVRLHKFTIAHVAFYVSDKGVFYAVNDIAALSVYMTLA